MYKLKVWKYRKKEIYEFQVTMLNFTRALCSWKAVMVKKRTP